MICIFFHVCYLLIKKIKSLFPKSATILFLLVSGLLLIPMPSALAQSIDVEVTVTIEEIETHASTNIDDFSSADFYAIVKIDGFVLNNKDTLPQILENDDNSIQPHWKFVQDIQYIPGSTIPITIQIWDDDDPLLDDHIDIDPRKDGKNDDVTMTLSPCVITLETPPMNSAAPLTAECDERMQSGASGTASIPFALVRYNISVEPEFLETVSNNNDCLIATAAYGTELAPQVQFLREIRDNTLMSTISGSAFMTGFNILYYSFAPTVAGWERENPLFQEAVRTFITPMISTLSIMALADEGSEFQVVIFGISTIGLIVGMYIIAPAITINYVWKKRKHNTI
jgi:hypothetical protein